MGIALLATGTVARAGSVLSATETAQLISGNIPPTTGTSIPYTVQYSQLHNLPPTYVNSCCSCCFTEVSEVKYKNNQLLILLPPVGGQVRSGEALENNWVNIGHFRHAVIAAYIAL
jgi:hypothetical protein